MLISDLLDLISDHIMNINITYVDDFIHIKIYCTEIEKLIIKPFIDELETNCDCHNPFCQCNSIYDCECTFFLFEFIHQ